MKKDDFFLYASDSIKKINVSNAMEKDTGKTINYCSSSQMG